MALGSSIEWTEATWNPVAGCAIVSPGCTNCYAMRMASRLQAMGCDKYAGTTRKSGSRHVWTGRVNVDRESLDAPKKWRRPRRIFVNSMSDLFHENVPESFISDVWQVMKDADWHTYQILTKRPDRMSGVLSRRGFPLLPHVWLGTSIESEEQLTRLKDLTKVPALIRFVSFEPLLGPIPRTDLAGVHWVIVGGESGPRARPMSKAWAESIRKDCKRQGVAFFFKQWGGFNKKEAGRSLNGRVWDEYPRLARRDLVIRPGDAAAA
jgi:protein gp37